MKKNIIGSVFGFLLAAFVAPAAFADGDVYEFREITEVNTAATSSSLSAGDTVKFKLRLLNRNYDRPFGPTAYKWEIYAKDSGMSVDDQKLKWAISPLRLGVVINGRTEYADLEYSAEVAPTQLTDFDCTYTIKHGDFALPLRLAKNDYGVAVDPFTRDPQADSQYFFKNDLIWGIRAVTNGVPVLNADGSYVDFEPWFSSEEIQYIGSEERNGCIDLINFGGSGKGYFIKTLDFDPDPDHMADATYWRVMHEASTTYEGLYEPYIELTGEAPSSTDGLKVYVWSSNEKAVLPAAKSDVKVTTESILFPGETDARLVQVAQISIRPGEKMFSLPLRGGPRGEGSGEGQTATLYLASKKGFTYIASSGDLLEDYLTVQVKCGAPEPSAMKVSVVNGGAEVGSVNADEYFKITKATIVVGPSGEPYEDGSYTVKLVPSLTKFPGDATAWKKYVRVSTSDQPSAWQGLDDIVFTFGAGDTEPKKAYLFVLGGGDDTTGLNFLEFAPVIDNAEAKAFYEKGEGLISAKINVVPNAPAITSPANGSTITDEITAKIPFSFGLKITDTYANYIDAKNNDVGYTIKYKTTDESSWRTLDGIYKFELETPGDVVTGYLKQNSADPQFTLEKAGAKELQIQLVPPAGETCQSSADYKVSITVDKPATIECSVSDPEASYEEYTDLNDEKGIVRVKVSNMTRPNKEDMTIYAFLVPMDEDTSNRVTLVSGKNKNIAVPGATSGMKILPEGTTSSESTFIIADGGSPASTLSFNIVLCQSQIYDPEKLVAGYQGTLTVYAANVLPSVFEVDVSGITLGADESGSILAGTIPMGVERSIRITTAESEVDLTDKSGTKTEEDVTTTTKKTFANPDGYSFYTELKIVGADKSTMTYVYYGDPSEREICHTFNGTGRATVTIRMNDKDMTGNQKAKTQYTFYIDVDNRPSVFVEDAYFTEDAIDKGERPSIAVGLSTAASHNLKIGLKLESKDEAGTSNKSVLKLSATPHERTAAEDWDYEVDFSAGRTEPNNIVAVDDLDGTIASLKGWTVTATVITQTVNPQTGKPWSEYYTEGTGRVIVENVQPVLLSSLGDPEVNAVTNKGQIGVNAAVSWSVSDIKHDVEGGINVQWYTPDKGFAAVTNVKDTAEYYFTPEFTSSGIKVVRCYVWDKDMRDKRIYEWIYEIEAAKILKVTANGPGCEIQKGISWAQDYYASAGSGAGHVWADATFSGAKNFTISYLCGNKLSVNVVGWGYKTLDPEDNGTLNGGRDVPLNTVGDNTSSDGSKPVECYNYTNGYHGDAKFDSFRYAWLITAVTDGTSETTRSLSVEVNNESPNLSAGLPAEMNEDGGYYDTFVQAIFSKELRELDNCGDINCDYIPDIYVARYGFGIYDANTGTVTDDLKTNLADFNDDTDYLPAKTTQGNRIVPGVVSGWADEDREFNAMLEIRGFELGLNAGYKNGKGELDDRDFGIYEEMAFRMYYNADPNTTDPVKVNIGDTELAEVSQTQKAALTEYWKQQVRDRGWTPENPTDPTTDDTDKDKLPDGYEYWFWYGATVGYADADGKWQGPMTGARFNEDDVENPTVISSKEIIAAFNPTVPSGESWTKRDTDNDGLTDYEEFLIGTNPILCDTDGDGLPDGWEVMRGLNPISPDEIAAGKNNPDRDYMADATVEANFICVSNRLYLTSDAVSEKTTQFYGVCIKDGETKAAAYTNELFNYNGVLLPKTRALVRRQVRIPAGSTVTVAKDTIHLLHDQVYAYFGFDPRTAWNVIDSGKFVSSRWISSDDMTGEAVNTRAFTTLDEFLLFKYRKATGIDIAGSTVLERLAAGTTNPSVPFSDKTYGNSELVYADEMHGADTDGDGIPDGWELYVGASHKLTWKDGKFVEDTTVQVTPNSALDNIDYDSDGLALALEFAGTDSSIAYAGASVDDVARCESIVALCGQVWPNKFFPTDPWNEDTDGDTIADGAEGADWSASTPYGTCNLSFNYIEQALGNDSAAYDFSTKCFRGGGMNPCTVDTDCDGLPDPWEKQFAGVPYNASLSPLKSNADIYTDAMKLADGLNSSGTNGVSAVGAFLVGGMDATFAGDAWTSKVADPQTGTVRDFDFDCDGLQNYQEYLVQAVRQFRYDDAETPLNGRVAIWKGDETEKKASDLGGNVEVKDAVEDYSYPSFDFLSSVKGFAAAIDAALGRVYTNGNLYATGVKNGDTNIVEKQKWDYARMGYFAKCPHDWDRWNMQPKGQDNCKWGDESGYKLMLPPTALIGFWDGAAKKNAFGYTGMPMGENMGWDGQYRVKAKGYVSTDPRNRDTDGDGMDDFYELYHGMSPLYGASQDGSSTGDVIAEMYGNKVKSKECMNAWQGFTSAPVKYDFVKFPWFAGAPDADPDGDKLRNADEMIAGNMTSPENYHTDPTPLWLTEPTAKLSVTMQSYLLPAMDVQGGTQDWLYYPWMIGAGISQTGINDGNDAALYLFAFERNEGFDTDGDWSSDARELSRNVKSASDPLYFGDPSRRNALYLDGKGAAYQPVAGNGRVVIEDAYDMFRQFTVECWVKPETNVGEQVILERGSMYLPATAGSIQGQQHWRANFRLYIEDGVAKGMFDSSAAVESGSNEPQACCKVAGEKLPTNQWSHVALTFDGSELKIYVNGGVPVAKSAALIPANGIVAMTQDPEGGVYPAATYKALDGAFVIGARHQDQNGRITFPSDYKFDYYLKNGFVGYIAEVRVWDGVRTSTEIADAKDQAFSLEDVSANRDDVYDAWFGGRTRNNNEMAAASASVLPAQLMMHYNFSTLPGAYSADFAQQTAVGFGADPEVDAALRSPTWWSLSSNINSRVYTDTRVIPWVQNTVLHLPKFDGGFADTFYWNDKHVGYFAMAKDTAIPNTANPYGLASYGFERYNREFQLQRLSESNSSFVDAHQRYKFEVRSSFVGSSDLVAIGTAWAKRDSDFWDGQGAMTAWTDTAADTDADGLPDWWEAAIGKDVDPTDVDGFGITYAERYARDLASGVGVDYVKGKIEVVTKEAFADQVDLDADGMWDWWEDLYGIQGNAKSDADADPDSDGLSNYQEFLISEGDAPYGFMELNPTRKSTYVADGQKVADYYLAMNGTMEYLGEVLTDHDFMEDWWENKYGSEYANARKYDPWADVDGDGWSNFAECRAFMWCGAFSSDLIERWLDGSEAENNRVLCYPRPAIGLKVTYNNDQIQDIAGHTLIVRTMTTGKRVDATFVVHGTDSQTTEAQDHVIGSYYDGATVIHGFINPGCLIPTDVKLHKAELSAADRYRWRWYYNATDYAADQNGTEVIGSYEAYRSDKRSHTHVRLLAAEIDWGDPIAMAKSDAEGHYGDLQYTGDEGSGSIGTVDFHTGEYSINLETFKNIDSSVANSVFKFAYSYKIGKNWPQTIWISDTFDAINAQNETDGNQVYGTGRIKEGLNTVEAFIDFNTNGRWDEGEPYGMVKNIKVGWHKVPTVTMELTDTAKANMIERMAIADVTADAEGEEEAAGGENNGGATTEVSVKIVRVGFNGATNGTKRTVTAKSLDFVMDDRAYLTEADFLSDKKPDLDWKYLVKDAKMQGIGEVNSATYQVQKEDGTVLSTFDRQFASVRPNAEAVSPIDGAPVYSSSPTFQFTADETATAFSLQIMNFNGEIIYDSGVKMLGGRAAYAVGKCAYSFTPPIYAGTAVITNGLYWLADGTNYKWRVVAYNSKYNTAENYDYSDWTPFQMDNANVLRNPNQPTGYGKANVAVRYYGPARTDLNERLIVVEAFENADFTGQAMAQTRVLDIAKLDATYDVTTVNANLFGMEPGTVYLRAYIDLNNNGVWDKFEPWGYANYAGTDAKALYNPKAITIGTTDYDWKNPPSVTIYIEDTDYNQNEVPDCTELELFPATTEIVEDEDELNWYDWAGAGENADGSAAVGDVMAYAEIDGTLVGLSDGKYYLLDKGEKTPVVGNTANGLNFRVAYVYSTDDVYGVGKQFKPDSASLVVASVKEVKIALVHNQVYQEYGYDTLTANASAFANGNAVNTKEFTALDKKLLMRYFEAMGMIDAADLALDTTGGKYDYFDQFVDDLALTKPALANSLWEKYTLKAGSADSNSDGIADGWQLYVMFGPNGEIAASTAWTSAAAARTVTSDKTLTWVNEFDGGYMPTDPWQESTFKETYTTAKGTFTIPDKDAYAYHLKGNLKYADEDNDGLSNYDEYLAEKNDDYALNVNSAYTFKDSSTYTDILGQVVPDYFLRSLLSPKYYLGFKTTSHDFIETWFKDSADGQSLGLDRQRYEPYKDYNNDGWDNWSTVRYLQSGNVVYERETFTTKHTYVNPSTEFYETLINDTDKYEVLEDNVQLSKTSSGQGANEQADANTGKITVNIKSYVDTPRTTPAPKVELTLTFNRGDIVSEGSNDVYVTVQAFTSSAMPDGTWRIKVKPAELNNGVITRELAVDRNIYLKQGLNRFVAYAGLVYQPGQPFGCAADVNVGWDRVTDLKIDMRKTSAVIPRFNPAALGVAAEESEYGYVITDEGDFRQLISDITKPTIITIARRKINGEDCSRCVIFRKQLNPDGFNTVTEADVLNGFSFDLDWHFLRREAELQKMDPDSIYQVMYTVYASTGVLNEEENVIGVFIKTFDINRKKSAPISPSKLDLAQVATTRPEFKFAACEGNYTAFAFQLLDSTNGVVFASTNLMTAADANGYITYRPPVYFGAKHAYRPANLLPNGDYKWRVALLNAKFSNIEDDDWSAVAEFASIADHGNVAAFDMADVDVAIRYFGEAEISKDAPVVVELFRSADFTGVPEGRSVIFNGVGVTNEYTNAFTLVNTKISGVKPGDYYVRAYIDVTNDIYKSIWEPWGYQNNVVFREDFDPAVTNLYTPVSTKLVANTTARALVFLEDTDVNNDDIPDCLQGMPQLPELQPSEDLDGDGLSTREEWLWGTDPMNRDTDGDEFPDGYEVWAGLNPISEDYTIVKYMLSDGTIYPVRDQPVAYAAVEGDVMADAIIKRTVVKTHNAVSGDEYYFVLPKGALKPVVGKALPGTENGTIQLNTMSEYRYYRAALENYWNGADDCYLYAMSDAYLYASVNDVVTEVMENFTIHLMHWQVYREFGFETGVATPSDLADVTDAILADGTQVHTRPFFGIDKYLLADLTCGASAMDGSRFWGAEGSCLKPLESDFDHDGIPDGWELYVMLGDTPIKSSYGVNSLMPFAISPWTAYDDFKLVDDKLVYDGFKYRDANNKRVTYNDSEWTIADMYNDGINTADPYNRYSLLPGTGIEDKVARHYGLETPENQLKDYDNDGLSNWAEFLAYTNLHIKVDSWNAYSTGNVLDYFVKVGNKYLGEIVADHDWMDDWWEDQYDVNYISRYDFDTFDDKDFDGWSNWAEYNAGTDPTVEAKLSLVSANAGEDNVLAEYPIPRIGVTTTVDSEAAVGANIVLMAWQDDEIAGIPDAKWTISGSGEATASHTRFLGLNPNKLVELNLGPGSIAQGSVNIGIFDPNYFTETQKFDTNGVMTSNSFSLRHTADSSEWASYVYADDPDGAGSNTGKLPGEGMLNYLTGDITIDFTAIQNPDATVRVSETDEEKVTFPWFDRIPEADQVESYTKFIAALCKMAREQKRVSAKEKPNANEKYTFRCFLLRLGFIGDEFKNDRKILLKNFDGSSAYRTKESADKAKEKLEAQKAESEGNADGEV